MIFFVLSGFVLSYGFFKRPERFDFVHAIIKRYFRLTPIVLISILLAFVLLKLHLFFNTQADLMPTSWKSDNIGLLSALWQGIVGVYVTASDDFSLNSVLWTIYYEMIGSVLVFAILAMTGRDNRRGYVYGFLAIILIGTNFIGFLAGLILADIYHNRGRVYEIIANLSIFYKAIALMAAIYMGSFPPLRTAENLSRLQRPLLFLEDYALNQTIVHLAAAVIMLTLVLTSKRLNKTFELRPLVFLGSISYSMYAVHLLVLGSVGSLAYYIATRNGLPYNYCAAIAMAAYLPTALVVAVLMTKYVDKPAITLSRMASKWSFIKRSPKSRAMPVVPTPVTEES
jgi:peptidoglycan/LPS O-acetylase OafA/YrhL